MIQLFFKLILIPVQFPPQPLLPHKENLSNQIQTQFQEVPLLCPYKSPLSRAVQEDQAKAGSQAKVPTPFILIQHEEGDDAKNIVPKCAIG